MAELPKDKTGTFESGSFVPKEGRVKKLIPVISVMLFLCSGAAFAQPTDQPFQANLAFIVDQGAYTSRATFTVPDGKRLVIEYVSANVEMPLGQRFYAYIQTFINSPSGTSGANHNLISQAIGLIRWSSTSGYKDVFAIGQVVRLYADPHSFLTPSFVLTRYSNTGVANVRASVSGYLVDMP